MGNMWFLKKFKVKYMGILLNEIKRLCDEEGLSYSDLINKISGNSPHWRAKLIGDEHGELQQ